MVGDTLRIYLRRKQGGWAFQGRARTGSTLNSQGHDAATYIKLTGPRLLASEMKPDAEAIWADVRTLVDNPADERFIQLIIDGLDIFNPEAGEVASIVWDALRIALEPAASNINVTPIVVGAGLLGLLLGLMLGRGEKR